MLACACGRSFIYEQREMPRGAGGGFAGGGAAGGGSRPVKTEVLVRVDDFFTLWVNDVVLKHNDTVLWSDPQGSLTTQLPCGRNTIALVARNRWRVDGFDRGAIMDVVIGTPANHLVTDSTWRVAVGDLPHADASGWAPATDLGPHGMPPWGAVFSAFGTSNAHWLWSYNSNVPASAKPEQETLTLKRTFDVACP